LSVLPAQKRHDRGVAFGVQVVVRVMPEHKFKIGQRLFLLRALNAPAGAYVIIKRLPKHHGEFEYQIKSVAEPHERVARESQLKTTPWRNAPVVL
jgi:hypothetical protein